MLGASSGLLGSSGDVGGAASAASQDGGGGSGEAAVGVGGSSNMAGIGDEDPRRGDDFGDRSSAGNRWPRQETLALLQIRSDMGVVFRDSSLKGPLWDEVSRKMADLGYHRSAKKCKEKFENVYKYHRRTKEGRASKADGKTYRFFDQLEALENYPSPVPPPHRPPPVPEAVPVSVATPPAASAVAAAQVTVSSTTPSILSIPQSQGAVTITQRINPTNPLPTPPPPPRPQPQPSAIHSQSQLIQPHHFSHMPANPMPSSPSSSSSTSSDEEIFGRRKRKRKWKDFFVRLMKEVIDKQEELQKKFLEAIERREHDRVVREEAWKMQETARLNKEHEILVHERSMAAAKDAALIAFLQKLSEQQQIALPPPFSAQSQGQNQTTARPSPFPPPAGPLPQQSQPQAAQVPEAPPQPHPQSPQPQQPPLQRNVDAPKTNNGENLALSAGSSRWPKAEVQALIKFRTSLDQKYQENGPKGPLWEEISASMRKVGYNRSAKRCKEKWENINKYFKKVKESNKKRPEDSKTCPYFHQLDALYREKINKFDSSFNPHYGQKPPTLLHLEGGSMEQPIMARPEQQWPPAEDPGSDDAGPNQEEDDDDVNEDEDDDQGYEIVASSNAASSTGAAGTGGTTT
ncbi:hypothetical protein Nepgr_024112 [Nepenthes gracilis]|uniref:Myb-like domain-containing protein n=1 Tax=Nepenthes gracilis TaxID=150966 RepID=A0AAD3T401_NEPGR|nr:hypothetical protein Nepgr_024112 [Nepenthes gracilis]